MKNPSKPIASYVEAVEQLQNSVTTFRTARQSLQDSAESLDQIAKLHSDVARSLGKTEERIIGLLPDDFRRELTQQQQKTDKVARSLQAQLAVIEGAVSTVTSSLLKLEQDAHTRSREINDRLRKDTEEIAGDFSRQTQLAVTGMTANVRVSIEALSKNVDRLSGEIRSEEYLKSLREFNTELNRATQETARAADALTTASTGFTALLTDFTGSVEASLLELTGAQRSVPRWGIALLALQILLVFLILI